MADNQELLDCTCGNKPELEVTYKEKPWPIFTASVYCPKCGKATAPFMKLEEKEAREVATFIWNKTVGKK